MDQVEALQREIAGLREEVKAWKAYAEEKVREVLAPFDVVPASWRFSRLEARIFAMILASGDFPCSRARIYAAMYAVRVAGEEPCEKIIDVYVCRLRHKLKPRGITISTVWGAGFFVPAESRALLASMGFQQ